MRNLRIQRDTRKIYIADGSRYDLPFGIMGQLEFKLGEFLQNPRSFKAVVLTGGADLYPGLYGHHMHKDCGMPDIPRDQRDLFVARTALAWRIPIVGICRGAQLLNVLAGGWLVQDCDNHCKWHEVRTSDGRLIEVSSTHHQMMVPPRGGNFELLAWAEPRLSTYYKGGKRTGLIKHTLVPQETDCIYFPRMNALAMQYHPEYMPESSAAFDYAMQLMHDKLGLKVARSREQDPFVSLPKNDPGSEEPLDPKDKVANDARWKEDYLKNRTRAYRASLWKEEDAIEAAKKDLNDILKELAEKKKSTAEVSAVRAAKVSE